MTTVFANVEDDFQGGKKKKKKETNQRSDTGKQVSILPLQVFCRFRLETFFSEIFSLQFFNDLRMLFLQDMF